MKYRIKQKNGWFYPQYKKWLFWNYYPYRFAGITFHKHFDTLLEAQNFLLKYREDIIPYEV